MDHAPARSIAWLGLATDDLGGSLGFFAEHLGLAPELRERDFAVLRLASGQTVELFGGAQARLPQFARGPVAGFEVDDVTARRERMEAAGVRFIGPVHHGDAGRAWSHVVGPGGHVFELTQLPPGERTRGSGPPR